MTRNRYLAIGTAAIAAVAAAALIWGRPTPRPVETSPSAPVRQIYAINPNAATHDLTIKNHVAAPNSFVVKRGDRIRFANADGTDAHLTVKSNSGQLSLTEPGGFFVPAHAGIDFDSSPYNPGSYTIYSSSYSSLHVSVTIQ